MASLKAVRNAIEDALDSIDGLRIVDGAQINPPAAVVTLGNRGVNYHQTAQDGLAEWELRILVYVGTAYTRTARDLLDDYLDTTGDRSVKQAVEADSSLGGLVDDLIVSSARQDDFVFQEGNTVLQYLGAEFFVTIQAA
ncbi:MAG: hypothetical protein ACLFWR_13810 [Acidimicrobiales bacterium]